MESGGRSPVVPRSACAIVSVDDTVYVFGGESEDNFLDDVEIFDVKLNEWHKVASMPGLRLYAQASLLKLPKKFIRD